MLVLITSVMSVLEAHFYIMVHISRFNCGIRIAAVCLCALPHLPLSSILAQHNTHCSYICVCVCVCMFMWIEETNLFNDTGLT